jgi:hypothetical protein
MAVKVNGGPLKRSKRCERRNEVVKTEQITVFVVARRPIRSMIDRHVLRKRHRFGEIDHPNSDSFGVMDDEQTGADQFVTGEEGRLQQIGTQLFESSDQLSHKVTIKRQKLAQDVLHLLRLTNVLQVFADIISVALFGGGEPKKRERRARLVMECERVEGRR